jgi:Leucine-rich repeat (LRR) protein
MEDYQVEYFQKVKKSKIAYYLEAQCIPPVEVYDIKELKSINIFDSESDFWNIDQSVEIPRGKISEMKELEELSLSSPDIDDDFFRNEICQLSSLKILCLHGAFLTTIPDEIVNLKNLEEINIRFSRKSITKISKNLAKLHNLREIYIESEDDIIPLVYKIPFLVRLFISEGYEGKFKKYVHYSKVDLNLLKKERSS